MVLVVLTDSSFWDSIVFDGIDDVDVEAVTATFGTVEVVARGRAAGAKCPDCGHFSERVHDRYERKLKDLPLAEQGFAIWLVVRRFICGASDVRRAVLAVGRPVLEAGTASTGAGRRRCQSRMNTDRDLAVSAFAQGSAVLRSHPD